MFGPSQPTTLSSITLTTFYLFAFPISCTPFLNSLNTFSHSSMHSFRATDCNMANLSLTLNIIIDSKHYQASQQSVMEEERLTKFFYPSQVTRAGNYHFGQKVTKLLQTIVLSLFIPLDTKYELFYSISHTFICLLIISIYKKDKSILVVKLYIRVYMKSVLLIN